KDSGETVLITSIKMAFKLFDAHQRLKKREEALNESEKKYRQLVDTLQEGIWLIDKDSNTSFVNPRMAEMLGYTVEEMLGKPIFSFMDKRGVEIAKIGIDRGKQNITEQMDFELIRKDGNRLYSTLSAVPVIDEKGNYIGSLAGINDITERKRAEDALRESELKYRKLAEDMPALICTFLPDSTLTYVNKAYCELFQKQPEDLVGQKFLDFLPDDGTRENVRRQYISLTPENPVKTYEHKVIVSDGTNQYHWHRWTDRAFFSDDGQISYFQSIGQDITDHKRIEAALLESELKYRLLIEHSSDVVFCVDQNGEYKFVNQVFASTFGKTPDYFLGKTFWDIYPKEHADHRQAVSSRVFATGESQSVEVVVPLPDRTLYYIAKANPVRDETGKVVLNLTHATDITARKQAEESIKESLLEKEVLLSEIHHRVKNNMQVISGLLDLQARSSGNPELTGMLNESQRRIRSMALVHEKLYGSKDFARIDLADYVRTLSNELLQFHKTGPGKIDLIIQTDSLVYVDINKAIPCGLILNELISNVLKHAVPGDGSGKLQITINETKNKEIEIFVRDNGFGLPDDVDINQPRTVGLYLVNGLVRKQLDGQIEVRRDNGTEFRIKFPYDLSEGRSL
ncbi:MAG: PAS domain S-box protein, partial [Syntrophus sp. (in: bacteria)]